MKKYGIFLVCAGLILACLGLSAVWRNAKADLQKTDCLPEDPIAAFFNPLPYSGGTAGFLASLETDAYRNEALHAAALLEDAGTDAAYLSAFLDFTEAQAQSAADQWAGNLEAQGASTAGAWANVAEARIPPYRFAALSLISACQREGLACEFQFSPEETRRTLLENGFPEDFFPD